MSRDLVLFLCLIAYIIMFANGQTLHSPYNAFEGLSPGDSCHISLAASEFCPCPQPGPVVEKGLSLFRFVPASSASLGESGFPTKELRPQQFWLES